ncbi:MAG: sulfate respiration complex hexadecaheme cytochrome HmcA [Pseudomonadota bacterium]
MKIGKNWLYLAVILTVFVGCIYGNSISGSIPADVSSQNRADVIKIDSMAAFGRLEKPPVQFLHDAHTKALSQKDLGCDTCHLTKDNRIYPKFKRFEDTDKTAVMNIYHKECIACHGEMTIANEKTGPVDCDDCHTRKEKYLSARQPMGFDKSLHFTHSQANKNKCEQCHHEYSENKKKLFYAKGKEGTCRYCHEEKTQDNRISMRQASHLACINCHINTPAKQEINPPKTCSGCHGPIEQQKLKHKKIKNQSEITRMDRNQPDIVLLKSAPENIKTDEKSNRMAFVPFNHETHENSNETCRVCHHKSLQPCNECHTLNGFPAKSADGSITSPSNTLPDASTGPKAVILEKAMHKIDSSRSCQGCHNAGKQEKECAGCHAVMGKTREMKDEACIKCHSIPVEKLQRPSSLDDEISLARSALQAGKQITKTVHKDDIPEIVTIKRLSKKYEAVEFPHRLVINALVDRIKTNSLSNYFHNEKETICQGCHHNSPASKKPPQCASCHGKQWDEKTPLRPGILGAYHQQCIGCHQQMDIKKPVGCIECHKLKNIE